MNEPQANATSAIQLETEAALLSGGWKKRSLGGFIDRAGPLWTCKEEAGWAYGILAEARHLNPAQLVHGGLLETLMDHALSSIAWEASGRRVCVTLQMDTHFLAPARTGMFIEARGRVMHSTSSMLFMHGMLTVGSQPVMSAQALMKILAS
jgi:uncharacterized protein (TIGR00369 family)